VARRVRSSSKRGERMRSKREKGVREASRRQIVRLLSSRHKNLVKFRSSSCVLVSEGRGIH